MSKMFIILTCDYEIFGDGTGSIESCLIEPTESMLKIANKYSVPLTLMVDICEYHAFKNEEEKKSFPDGYTPASWIEKQLIDCIQSGHDVQLHIHPQWTNYTYYKERNEFRVDMGRWKVSSISYDELCKILKRGKETLENLLKPYKIEYRCFAFRAGAWSIQPERDVLRALSDTGFRIDSSVAPGCSYKDSLTAYDFRQMPDKPFWHIKENLKTDSGKGILEVPVYTVKYSFCDKIYYKFLKFLKEVKIRSCKYQGARDYKKKLDLAKKLSPVNVMFDFCAMSDSEMLDIIKKAQKKAEKFEIFPVVSIGHSKTFNNDKNFDSFIKRALDMGCKFATFKDIIHLTC